MGMLILLISFRLLSIKGSRHSRLPKDERKSSVLLLLLIAQHRSFCAREFNGRHTLRCSVNNSIIAMEPFFSIMLNFVDDLVHQYHLEPEVMRRAILLLRRASESSITWILDLGFSRNPITSS